jgi:hypothetical protein
MTTPNNHMHHRHLQPEAEMTVYPAAEHLHGRKPSLNRLAFQATLHCMTGCAIGEVAGMIIGTALGWGMWETVGLAVTLAFITGFALTMIPLMRSGMAWKQALGIAFAADFISVTVMEIVDNAVMIAIPGAMAAGRLDWFFWASLGAALGIAFVVALPVNLWLINRGKGHAGVHARHAHH